MTAEATSTRVRRRRGYETKDGYRLRGPELAVRYLLLLLVLAITVGPFVWQFLTSIKGVGDNLYAIPPIWLPKHATGENYARVTSIVPVLSFVGNSLIVAVSNVAINVIGSALAGYALARLRFRGRSLALSVFVGALLIPGEASIIALLQIMNSVHLTNTLVAVVLPGCIGALNVLLMRNAFLAIPHEIDEAAALDGANAWRRLWNIAMPAVTGTLAVVGLMSFIGSWDDFLWPLLVLTDTDKYTLTIGLNYLQSTFAGDPRVVAAGTIIAVVPLIILFIALQRQFFKGVGEGAVKG
ncbi:carbohydrate ABC transporter permease [Lacisediminihabitans changchengi]|uniref:Carbohydrate ABC transporter permease n=1 Tax=Lacisediminihabitans changchengi TaxID=2787634 RepID=A0A934W393_9MICO|nr:carbohydrate ABC transporter permease [Lacisediminihabitans changchengi]MBK4346290.1 carbohydrate ABC transporter permease [Lacisediminihabitans changchengi]